VSPAIPTSGPQHRYRFALFIEKEGFNPLLAQARIAERYDLPVMSTKGMTVTAARQLAEALAVKGVTILVLHDFDKSGLDISFAIFPPCGGVQLYEDATAISTPVR
jgi:DNA topoisomerase VI subunit A